jgi:hypothetical protein
MSYWPFQAQTTKTNSIEIELGSSDIAIDVQMSNDAEIGINFASELSKKGLLSSCNNQDRVSRMLESNWFELNRIESVAFHSHVGKLWSCRRHTILDQSVSAVAHPACKFSLQYLKHLKLDNRHVEKAVPVTYISRQGAGESKLEYSSPAFLCSNFCHHYLHKQAPTWKEVNAGPTTKAQKHDQIGAHRRKFSGLRVHSSTCLGPHLFSLLFLL